MTKRIIIIDDDKMFCLMMQRSFTDVLGYRADYTHDADEMYAMIRAAEDDGDPYEIATIDMDFPLPHTDSQFPLGQQVVANIKREFPYMRCIMVSGARIDGSQVLIMRDTLDLDFFVAKATLDPMRFKTYVQHVLEHRSQGKPAPPRKMPRVFLSYRRRNAWGQARAIANSLKEYGVDVFLDVESIGSGEFPAYITDNIIACDYFILLLAPTTLESEWVCKEIQDALDHDKTIIPVTLDGFEMHDRVIPPEFERLLTYNGLDITPHNYTGNIQTLVHKYMGIPETE